MFLKYFSEDDKKAFYTLAVNLICSDGVISESEEVLLAQYLDEMEIPKPKLMSPEEAFELLSDADAPLKRQIYIELLGLALCDAEYAADEAGFLAKTSALFGFSEKEKEDLSNCVQELLDVYSKMNQLIAQP